MIITIYLQVITL